MNPISLDAEGNPPLDRSVEMEEDTEYQRQLALFVRCSTEKGIELVKIGEIIAGLSHRRYFLDIGAGGGDLTIPISQSFTETTVVEPDEKQTSFLKRRCPYFKVYNDLWEKVDLGSKRYDFILCSHVLYYIKEGHWLNGQRIWRIYMVTIVFFLLIDRRFREYEEKVRSYFESQHKRANGYRMMQDEILLVIKKI